MKILVLNCGSSSIKYALYDMTDQTLLAAGGAERVGMEGSFVKIKYPGEKRNVMHDIPEHTEGVKFIFSLLTDPENGVIKSLSEIDAVGHRMVHGGEKFACSTLLTEEVLNTVEELNPLAPLHNPPTLVGVRACKELLPTTPMVGVFDTAFHQTMEPKAFIYAVPYEYYEKYGMRRYGFHGTSHRFVAQRTAEIMGKDPKDLKVIVCHLGNGSSISAVDGGKCVETSMGLTPLEGLIMGTRSGDMDPTCVEFIANNENLTLEETMQVINKKSGVLGISGVSSDFRDLGDAAKAGNERAQLALDAFCHHVVKYIGSYVAVMNGVDAIVFTAGIGENDTSVRRKVLESFSYLGIDIDPAQDNIRGKEALISTPDSKTKAYVIPTNEELMICRDTVEIVTKKYVEEAVNKVLGN